MTIRDRFIINGFKNERGDIGARPEDGFYSPAQIDIALDAIWNELEFGDLAEGWSKKPVGTFTFVVEFLDQEPYNRLAVSDVDGFSEEEIKMIIQGIRDQIL